MSVTITAVILGQMGRRHSRLMTLTNPAAWSAGTCVVLRNQFPSSAVRRRPARDPRFWRWHARSASPVLAPIAAAASSSTRALGVSLLGSQLQSDAGSQGLRSAFSVYSARRTQEHASADMLSQPTQRSAPRQRLPYRRVGRARSTVRRTI